VDGCSSPPARDVPWLSPPSTRARFNVTVLQPDVLSLWGGFAVLWTKVSTVVMCPETLHRPPPSEVFNFECEWPLSFQVFHKSQAYPPGFSREPPESPKRVFCLCVTYLVGEPWKFFCLCFPFPLRAVHASGCGEYVCDRRAAC